MSKWISALLSSLLICLIAAYGDYTPIDMRETGIGYESYFMLFITGWIILFPVYLLLGVPLSLVLDAAVERLFNGAPKGVAIAMKLISYLLGSVALGWGFSLLMGAGDWTAYRYPFMLGASVYWAFQELLRWAQKRIRRKAASSSMRG
ncbi:hypothetical protein [Paenibacillus dakarensis]|uniref:hypothetical protein n=1 Tax=Paenibacillus dakarensis TaxID=1527293 RepID=UPI0006D530E3|nr:hypothetical protein [Paenibacillus dakarensis]